MRWDPTQYLRFADDRGRPFVDLVARIRGDAATVVDLGCGAGNLTSVLRGRWPDAQVLGVDASPEMIERAKAADDDPGARYELADVETWAPAEPVDVITSNAMFQWVPEQEAVLRRLADAVLPGGSIAVQVPNNADAPSHSLVREVADRPRYADHTRGVLGVRGTAPEVYLELFADLGWECDAWETTYLHVLPGEDPVFEWVKGTGARPVLAALPDGLREEFVEEYKAELRTAYPRRPFGTVLPFRRTFAVATRPLG
ncbi:methyltransferase domain-containing protein [Aeromicrobium sp. Leaf245]|uniref:methyltransferase domain-containing protein n=1 Tax=Aeromicrobium sp. Leaf245 TaxID=1736306 RepID=UPI0006FCEDF4|nr:methyltransferase domain-containing protein [Aeromicrobium sp. Leaf245]KQO41940.1 trans-aconitate methyltransferase [Aeromicrobium sp. Leaf245]